MVVFLQVSGADPSTAAPPAAATPPPYTAFAASASVETSSGPPLHHVPPHASGQLVTTAAARQPPTTTTAQFSPAASTTNTQTSSVASAIPGAGAPTSSSSFSQTSTTMRYSQNVPPYDGLATSTTDPLNPGGGNHIGNGPILTNTDQVTNDQLGFMQSSRPLGVSSSGQSAAGGSSSISTTASGSTNPSLQTQTVPGHSDTASLPLTTASNLVPAATTTTSKTPTHQHRTPPPPPPQTSTSSFSYSSRRPVAKSAAEGAAEGGSGAPPSLNTLPTPHSYSPLPVGASSRAASVTSSPSSGAAAANHSLPEGVTTPTGDANVTAGPYGIGRSTGDCLLLVSDDWTFFLLIYNSVIVFFCLHAACLYDLISFPCS